MKKKRLPKFRRQQWFLFKRLGEKWRAPSGEDSLMRVRRKGKGRMPNVGYRTPKAIRGLHPSGLSEVLVRNPSVLQGIDSGKQAVRIASEVGMRKREQILKRADELKIRVLNPGVKKHEAGHEEKASS
jgi:large subunit ribosomal protein L32e